VALTFDPRCQAAIDLAKRSLPDGAALDTVTLLAALYREADISAKYPALGRFLPYIEAYRSKPPEKVPLAPNLRSAMQPLSSREDPIGAIELFEHILASESGRATLNARGVPAAAIAPSGGASTPAPAPGSSPGAPAATAPTATPAFAAPTAADAPPAPRPGWRTSEARQKAIRALDSFGRMLTETELAHSPVTEREATLKALIRTLSKMKRRNAIVIGPPGTGKSAIIYELARRIRRDDSSLPPRIRDMDIFELSPTFLRSGASMVGQYEERVKNLLGVLTTNRNIILFVDEIHSMFRSGVHERGPFSDANESFKGALASGDITCIGCTTPAEFRNSIEPDKALERRFGLIRLEAPSREVTLKILQGRRPKMEDYYAPLKIPDAILKTAIELTEDYLPSRFQPDKSIQLVDEACAFCVTGETPPPVVTEDALREALEDIIGHSIARRGVLTEQGVREALQAKIVGQDEVIGKIAQAFVASLGEWGKRNGPRGVFLFGGPTGVGKTETALVLANILGAGDDRLIRVDCNTLQGGELDAGPVINRLLGVPPGYIGYARGQGGILSRIRDLPECVVLFDEFEKAGPAVGRLLLQIIDDGTVDDVDGNTLDFRRAFVVFTTNAGCVYDKAEVGFGGQTTTEGFVPQVDPKALKRDLHALGVGEEFLGRMTHILHFKGLDASSIRVILERQLAGLRKNSELHGLRLDWKPELIEHLASQWQPRFGVRLLTQILRNRIIEQLGIAEAQGELKGIEEIRLDLLPSAPAPGTAAGAGVAMRWTNGKTLVIGLS
jgi:ATP-dependent Clp protease ATP-binding subunit ClpA